MRFQFDQEVKYIEMSVRWMLAYGKYDSTSNALSIINSQTKEEKTMKVLKLQNVPISYWNLKDPGRRTAKMYMIVGWMVRLTLWHII